MSHHVPLLITSDSPMQPAPFINIHTYHHVTSCKEKRKHYSISLHRLEIKLNTEEGSSELKQLFFLMLFSRPVWLLMKLICLHFFVYFQLHAIVYLPSWPNKLTQKSSQGIFYQQELLAVVLLALFVFHVLECFGGSQTSAIFSWKQRLCCHR